jgi:hypothetical protein
LRPRSKVIVFAKPRPPAPAPRKPYGPRPVIGSALDAVPDTFARTMRRDQGEELESDGVPLRAWVPNFLSKWF